LIAILNDFKVMVERGHLIHLGHGDVHQFGQSHQVTLMQATVRVIELVQMLNEQIASLFQNVAFYAQQMLDLLQRELVCLSTLELSPLAKLQRHLFGAGQSHNGGGCCFFSDHVVSILEGVSGFERR
jgi:hypothetical protein